MTAHAFSVFGGSDFLAGSPTPQLPERQVGTPSFGKSHCVSTTQAITNSASSSQGFTSAHHCRAREQLSRQVLPNGISSLTLKARSAQLLQLALLLHLFNKVVHRKLGFVPEEADEGILGVLGRSGSFGV